MEVNKIICGDTLETVKTFPDESIDCVITSPPYYQLRDYGWDGQWGLEPTYQEYLDKLIELMKELKRVLKPTGTMWINLGDTYMNNSSYSERGRQGFNNDKSGMIYKSDEKIKQKSLMLIPHRFAIRCIDELGLILRNDIIWAKRNGMPESVTDRFSKKHEFIFFFVKNEKYYFDLASIGDKYLHIKSGIIVGGNKYREMLGNRSTNGYNKGYKNPGDVSDFWDIPTKPNKEKHYATYNSQLIDKPIIAGCPEGGIILDPFCGIGTTLVRAIELNRNTIGIDGKKEYCEIAQAKLNEVLRQQKLFSNIKEEQCSNLMAEK